MSIFSLLNIPETTEYSEINQLISTRLAILHEEIAKLHKYIARSAMDLELHKSMPMKRKSILDDARQGLEAKELEKARKRIIGAENEINRLKDALTEYHRHKLAPSAEITIARFSEELRAHSESPEGGHLPWLVPTPEADRMSPFKHEQDDSVRFPGIHHRHENSARPQPVPPAPIRPEASVQSPRLVRFAPQLPATTGTPRVGIFRKKLMQYMEPRQHIQDLPKHS